jgi:hypothetical protein
MSFVLRWQHDDGSIVEFSTSGWKSDDAAKTRWLNQISDLCSSTPVISPGIRIWLQENCRLIEVRRPPEVFSDASDHDKSGAGEDDKAFLPPGGRRLRSIQTACEQFFRSRGMWTKGSGTVWQRDKQAVQSTPQVEIAHLT